MKRLHWSVTGDCHGYFEKLKFLKEAPDESEAIIILGDSCLNFSDSKIEHSNKSVINSWHNYIYVLRGNHDLRPEKIKDHEIIYDDNISGPVYMDKRRWPFIRYLIDGEIYQIDGFKVLAIGGAYSVDKEQRLLNNDKWFKDEQLSKKEMDNIKVKIKDQKFDFVLTHTCPFEWQPLDKFLSWVNQEKVDKTTENFLQEIKDNIDFKVWLFGHFHSDRKVRPNVLMLMDRVLGLRDIYDAFYNDKGENLIGLEYDPNYFIDKE